MANLNKSTPVAAAASVTYEALPTLNGSEILQPQYFQGRNFTVRNPVPSYFGSNQYTIDSDFLGFLKPTATKC